MEQKAQSAVEYLLLIGAAVLVAAVVIAVLIMVSGPTEGKVNSLVNEVLHVA